jgi:hypothetical protein
MSEDQQAEATPNEVPHPEPILMAMSDFLESVPPNQLAHIGKLTESVNDGSWVNVVFVPEIQSHCPEDKCNGLRFFRCTKRKSDAPRITSSSYSYFYITYRCSNCQKNERVFSIAAKVNKDDEGGTAYKFGELPPFGPRTPSRLITLIGPDRETFLKGRRCENQGLGIGAFIYYRRVVENQKNRIVAEIRKVADKLGASQSTLQALDSATNETQFTKALQIAKEGIPESLLINGHNPMLLLHSALSEGVHEKSDEECMEIASSVRIVLGELSERLAQALKDEAELRHALSTLMNKKV